MQSNSLPRFAYFPFGGGPRLCIGAAFAMMEANLLLAAIAQRFQLRLVPGHPVSPCPALRSVPGTECGCRIRKTKPRVTSE